MGKKVADIMQPDARYSQVFNTGLWKDIQDRISRALGVSIKVVSEDGSINIPESNFSPVCDLLKTSEKATAVCTDFKVKKIDEETGTVKCDTCGELPHIKCYPR